MARASDIPQPFLKWAGGKRQLVSEIADIFPKSFWQGKARFYEPFLGGGALTLHLGNPKTSVYVPGNRLILNDVNPDLITTYTQVRDNVTQLISRLEKLSQDLPKVHFLIYGSQYLTEKLTSQQGLST